MPKTTMMSSWNLLRALINFWMVDNPVFVREANHPPAWYSLGARVSKATGVVLTLGGLGCYLSVLLTFYLNSLLVLLLPLLVIWMVLVSITLGTVIVEEREGRTWETLRTVPLATESLVLGKAGGALWWLRDLIRMMSGLLLLVAIGIGLVSLILIPNTVDSSSEVLPSVLLCGGVIVLPLISAGVYVADRAQQFVLLATSALLVSAQSQSVRIAMSWAVVIAFITWLVDVGIAVVVLAVIPHEVAGQPDTNLMALALLGPVVSYLSALSLPVAAVIIGCTLLSREVAVRAMWRITLQYARTVD